jgi:hypothetical protein
MNYILRRMVWLAIFGAMLSTTGLARPGFQTKLEGTINDFTTDLDGGGPWIVHGPWTLEIQGASGKADFSVSISMVRSDNATRQAHTHHVGFNNGAVTPIAGGYRITGGATMTSNGSQAGFSGSEITIEVVGGNSVPFSNVRLTFAGASAVHFGTEPLDGVVARAR